MMIFPAHLRCARGCPNYEPFDWRLSGVRTCCTTDASDCLVSEQSIRRIGSGILEPSKLTTVSPT